MNPPQPAALLEVKRLSKSYAGLPAVDGVSFSIRPGEILGYLGPNASGKSTTVKMLAGVADPWSGGIRFWAVGGIWIASVHPAAWNRDGWPKKVPPFSKVFRSTATGTPPSRLTQKA